MNTGLLLTSLVDCGKSFRVSALLLPTRVSFTMQIGVITCFYALSYTLLRDTLVATFCIYAEFRCQFLYTQENVSLLVAIVSVANKFFSLVI